MVTCQLQSKSFPYLYVQWYRCINNTQTSDKHTHTDRNMDCGGMFSRFPFSVPRRQGTWGTLDSECLNLHCLKDSGTKTMAFQCEGHRCEWCFLKHQSSDDLPEAVLTVDSHCQYTCKVCAQSQSSISCVAELLTSRHSICASKLSKHPQPCRWFQKLQHPVCYVLHCESWNFSSFGDTEL